MADTWFINIGSCQRSRPEPARIEMVVTLIPTLTYTPTTPRGTPVIISEIYEHVVEKKIIPWYFNRMREHARELGNIRLHDCYIRKERIVLNFDVTLAIEEEIEQMLALVEDPDIDCDHTIAINRRKLQVSSRDVRVFKQEKA